MEAMKRFSTNAFYENLIAALTDDGKDLRVLENLFPVG
jgi:hypothetical protein